MTPQWPLKSLSRKIKMSKAAQREQSYFDMGKKHRRDGYKLNFGKRYNKYLKAAYFRGYNSASKWRKQPDSFMTHIKNFMGGLK